MNRGILAFAEDSGELEKGLSGPEKILNLPPFVLAKREVAKAIFRTEFVKSGLESFGPAEHEKGGIPSSFDILDWNKLRGSSLQIAKCFAALWASIDVNSDVSNLGWRLTMRYI